MKPVVQMGTSVDPVAGTPCSGGLQRVRAEYREMPSLRLTALEAQRLFGLTPLLCVTILETEQNFLCRTGDDLFVRSARH
jgi:hypothetical protein